MKHTAFRTLMARASKVWTILSALALTAGILTPYPIAAHAAQPATLYATVNGGGTAEMQGPILFGITSFGMGIHLYSDGTASGELHCIDQHGGTSPGNVWGQVTTWSRDGDGNIVLHVSDGQIVFFQGGHAKHIGPFDVTIQSFGGAGVGHWTLAGPYGDNGEWITVCVELLTSGQIVIRYA